MPKSRVETKCRIGPILYERDWSDRELARRTGISRSRVNTIKNGHTQASTIEALLIARVLDCKVADIFTLDPDPDWLTERGM